MTDPLSASYALQVQLLTITEPLSREIAKPFDQRDPNILRRGLEDLAPYRSQLGATLRGLRKQKRIPLRESDAKSRTELSKRRAHLRNLRGQLAMWDGMHALIDGHVRAAPTPLALSRPQDTMDPAFTLIYRALHRLANPNPQTDEAKSHGCFADIAMPPLQFELLMTAAYRLSRAQGKSDAVQFLDVGCGGGTKVMMASRYFRHCDGLEYDPAYADAAQASLKTIGLDHCGVIHADALTFDGYASYDVIYFYRPLQDDPQLFKMEQRILDQVRPGTLILAPYAPSLEPHKDFPAAQVLQCIFIAGVSQPEADKLRRNAEHTDTQIIGRPGDLPFDPGFWAPILQNASYAIPAGLRPKA